MKNSLKKVFALVIFAAMLISLVSCGSTTNEPSFTPVAEYTREFEGTEINVFNWGEYISDGSEDSLDVNAEFEKLTGIKVNYDNYESNEAMYAKLKSGAVSYDIIIPSDYMIERLVSEDMLTEVDFSKITNYGLIDERYKGLYFDPEEKFSVPYNVGMVGLIYNSSTVEETPDSWAVMWDEKYKGDILTFNNPRDSFAIAQLLLGIDLNTTDKAELDAAAALLKEQKKDVQAYMLDEAARTKIESENADIAVIYNGEAYLAFEANDKLDFVIPEEGTCIWLDAFAIPKDAENKENAELFLDFLCREDIAAMNFEYIYYSTPNKAVVDSLDPEILEEEAIFPEESVYENPTVFQYLGKEIEEYYTKLWKEILVY